MYEMKRLTPPCDYACALRIREEVFTKEQGFSSPDEDAFDPRSHHIILFSTGNDPVATGRCYADPDTPGLYHIGRVCIRKCARGLGLGRVLMEALESLSIELGAEELTLDAQLYAVPFYEKCGFSPTGKRFFDEFCEHETLFKKLSSPVNTAQPQALPAKSAPDI